MGRLQQPRPHTLSHISPYLARSSEVPGSAKRLQQLALLESVADESARMLSHRPPPPMGNPRPVMHNNSTLLAHYPLPPASVPPPPVFPHDPMHVLYSSGQQQQPPGHGFNGMHPGQDPFQVRPWTSQAFHRGPMHPPGPSSMSMSQGQLLALMNGPRGTPMPPPPPPHMYGVPPMHGVPRSYFPAQPMGPHAGAHYPMRAGPPTALRPGFGVGPGPLSAPAMSPGFPAHNPALLSILNGGRGAQ
ncbi:hypothetical protein B0H17DRAFT_615382 [Mycena rosella]|uniref:Uncharacterized protein n=1 Tax=Mycena rosella TaxID=1033263 RepID=A0AAD7GVK1_MYCRO|nr:hypothetical protein B0H17DRAFT_615382 [Mycena rosella]